MKEVEFFISEDSKVGQNLKHSASINHFSERSLHAEVVENSYVLMYRIWYSDLCDGGVVDADLLCV